MNTFQELKESILQKAKLIEEKWLKSENSYEEFPSIVLSEFQDFDFFYFSELSNLPEILDDASIRKLQGPSSFSDLYYRIFDNGKFWIEILNWWGLDINIHDHDFSAVQFQLAGESFNTVYSFTDQQKIPNLTYGSFDIKRVELWQPGDYSVVKPGRSEPHNVVHLNIPSVSLLIRTHPHSSYGPQNNYFPPNLRANYGLADNYFRKKIALLRLLSKGDKEKFFKTFKTIVSNQSSSENLFTIIKMTDVLFSKQNENLLIDFSDSKKTMNQLIIQAGASYKNVTFLTYIVKNTDGLSQNDLYLIAILICSFDKKSFNNIYSKFRSLKPNFNLSKTLRNIEKHLSYENYILFKNCFKLYGIKYEYAV